MNLTISILELLSKRGWSTNRYKSKTSYEIANTIKQDPRKVAAMCSRLFELGLLAREQKQNPSIGLLPWYYQVTKKGRKFLFHKLQLKALLHEQE